MITSLPATTNQEIALFHWVAQYSNSMSVVLDVGAGRGRIKSTAIVKQHVGQLVGVDPDPVIAENPYLDEWYCSKVEDFAREYHGKFDLLYSMMVLEHLTDPDAFFSACRSLLKLGGMFFAITPNLWHYFGLATKLTSILGVNEWLLDRLIGKQAKEEYHFPTVYKINSISSIQRMLKQTGFHDVEFRCFDNPINYRYVIPKPLRWFPWLYSRTVYTLNMPRYMGRIMFRATVNDT